MSPRLRALCGVACAVLLGGCGAGESRSADRRPPVVRVTVATDGLVPQVATGVAAGDGRVVTVAHALSGGHGVTVAGRRARVVRVDRRLDLALLAVPALRAPAVRFGDEATRVAIPVVRGAGARSLTGRVRRRVVVLWRDQPGDPAHRRPALELAARIEPGDSGAPVVDRRGRVLGMLYARSEDDDGTAWAVAAPAVRAFLAG